jgi:hypothetical protein
MKTALIIVIAIGVIAVLYGLYRVLRKPSQAVIDEELSKRRTGIDQPRGVDLPRGMGQHAAAQDPSWVNRETHGNMG